MSSDQIKWLKGYLFRQAFLVFFCCLRESTESKSDNVDACDMLKEGTGETAVAALEEVLQDKLISSAEFTMWTHYDFKTDKVYNLLRIPVLIDTCAMRH